MAAEVARVSQRCEEAKETKELVLDGCELKTFPDAIFFLLRGVELTRVSLARNSLRKMIPKIALSFTTISSELNRSPLQQSTSQVQHAYNT